MNKSDLASRIATDASLSRAAVDSVIDAVFSTISSRDVRHVRSGLVDGSA